MLDADTAVTEFREIRFAGLRFTPMNLDEAVAAADARDPKAPFAAYITPNAEHVYLAKRVPALLAVNTTAYVSINDSRILHRAAKFAGLELKLAAGSDIIPRMFAEVVRSDDALTVIGASADLVEDLRARYGLTRISQHIPSMGFINDPAAVQAAVDFVAAHPARFIFVAMGPPQSEQFCNYVRLDGRSTGLALCIGSALNQLTGVLQPAPAWMGRAGLLWLHRLLKEPRRLWRRYLVNDMIALGWCIRDIVAIRLGLKRA